MAEEYVLTLKPSRAVRQVAVPRMDLRIFFQSYPGVSGLDADRAIAGVNYVLRIPGKTEEISGVTAPNGEISLPDLRPGMTAELEIFGTLLRLTPHDFEGNEISGGAEDDPMCIEGAKRRLMIIGYYDEPYRAGSKQSQRPDDNLDFFEIEDAILQFQVDSKLEPNGEIERHGVNTITLGVDKDYSAGFHKNRKASSLKKPRFDPSFDTQLAAAGGQAPNGTMTPPADSQKPLALPARKVSEPIPPTSLEREIYDGHRFVPVRFRRLDSKRASKRNPELDERGYDDGRFGPVVSVMTGETIQVRMENLHISDSTSLNFVSSPPTAVQINRNGDIIELTGLAGAGAMKAEPQTAKIEVRFGSDTGPLLGRLYVDVYDVITVATVVHSVSIGQSGHPEIVSVGPDLNNDHIETLLGGLNSIWNAAGIQFALADKEFVEKGTVRPWLNFPGNVFRSGENWLRETTTLSAVGSMKENEFEMIAILNQVDNCLNMFVVPSIEDGNIVALGKRGQGVALRSGSLGANSLSRIAAHEAGHFLNLSHPGTYSFKGNGDNVTILDGVVHDISPQDYWSCRTLMYKSERLRDESVPDPLPNFVRQRRRQDDVGYGAGIPGTMLGCRKVSLIKTIQKESEIFRARTEALNYSSVRHGIPLWNPPATPALPQVLPPEPAQVPPQVLPPEPAQVPPQVLPPEPAQAPPQVSPQEPAQAGR